MTIEYGTQPKIPQPLVKKVSKLLTRGIFISYQPRHRYPRQLNFSSDTFSEPAQLGGKTTDLATLKGTTGTGLVAGVQSQTKGPMAGT